MGRQLLKQRHTGKMGTFGSISPTSMCFQPYDAVHSCGAQAHVSQDTKGNKMTESSQTDTSSNPTPDPDPSDPFMDGPDSPADPAAPATNPFMDTPNTPAEPNDGA
jgi:hypothetical protein